MRKVVAGLFISLDGVIESPDQWQLDFDDEMVAEIVHQVETQDAILFGRVTYQEWAGYWPTATDQPFADFINNNPKYVFSSTLDAAEWRNSVLVTDEPRPTIERLKKKPGKNIGVHGSPSLLAEDLLDELRLMIHPVIAGTGQRLITDGSAQKRLTLAEARRTPSGTIIASYQLHP